LKTKILILFIGLFTAACSVLPEESIPGSNLHIANLGQAPELTNTTWINTEQSLRLADLRGQIVLPDMWAFGLITYRNVIPSLRECHQTNKDLRLVIIGNHYSEFSHDSDLVNLKQAVNELRIEYPVAQDNDVRTLRAYNIHYWPTLYLIDKKGNLRYVHIGEGAYGETEAAIQTLLAETYP